MDLTWLALTVRVSAMIAITCLVWSIFQELAEPRQMEKALRCIEADAGNLEKRRRRFLVDFFNVYNNAKVFIGS